MKMDVQSKKQAGTRLKRSTGRIVSGISLIVLGSLWFLNEFLDFSGNWFLPALALVFLVWGILTRSGGLLIPGGILGGIAVGINLMSVYDGDAEAGVFLLSFAGGWGLITLLSAIFTDEPQWWALIPGAVMALIGAALFFGGFALTLLGYLEKGWPLILIAIGVFILLKRR
jgi:hypothetical protein